MKKFEIHPDALNNFNYKINSLINKLELKEDNQKDSKYNPQFYNVQEIDGKKIIGDVIKWTIDEYGNEISKSFLNKKGSVGLYELNYREYENICEGIQKLNPFKNIISLNTIKELVFKWLIKKCKNESNLEPIEYLINECQIEIREWEIITPIAELYIEYEFEIGNVKLKTLSKEIIDSWESFYIKKNEGNNEENREVVNHYEELRKLYSGKATASYTIEAELDRAIEIANEEVDKTLSILRYFSRANAVPNLISCCTISGNENVKNTKNLILENSLLVRENVNIGRD